MILQGLPVGGTVCVEEIGVESLLVHVDRVIKREREQKRLLLLNIV